MFVLGWDEQKICFNTLALEQLLTTGGGWQDQFGGVYGGIKLCSSFAGLQDTVQVHRLPSELMIQSDTSGLWLLYYTGITRVAKDILADIVTNMFLNNKTVLDAEYEIMANASSIADAIQFCDYGKVADCVKNSWNLNKQLDKGVSSSEIEEIIKRIDENGYEWIRTELGIKIEKDDPEMNELSIGTCATKEIIKGGK